jgi:F-type H+-transporting ATPase subunit epsilon
MAAEDALRVELVAADRTIWSGEASQVSARTSEGDLGVLAGHAPVLALLVPGVVRIEHGTDVTFAVVEEGFLSIADDRVSILSEVAHLAGEIDRTEAERELERAKVEGNEALLRRAEAKLRGSELA